MRPLQLRETACENAQNPDPSLELDPLPGQYLGLDRHLIRDTKVADITVTAQRVSTVVKMTATEDIMGKSGDPVEMPKTAS